MTIFFTSFALAQESGKKEVIREEKIIKKDGKPRHEQDIPNLSEDQKKKMKEIKIRTRKETMQVENQMGEKKARLKTLTMMDKPDINEINKTVDEWMGMQAIVMKKKLGSAQEIRALLNEEQRVVFDSKIQRKMNKRMGSNGQGPHPMED